MDFAKLVLIAILVEAIWENCKMAWTDKKPNVNMIGSLILSIAICLGVQIDLFELIGLPIVIPFFGCVLTGIIVSRGANFVNDLFSKLKGE